MPDIVTRVKKIESEGHGFVIDSAAMQSIEICGPIGRQVNNLGINSQGLTQPRRFLDNAGITLRPVSRYAHGSAAGSRHASARAPNRNRMETF
jgi:hypothetical protein